MSLNGYNYIGLQNIENVSNSENLNGITYDSITDSTQIDNNLIIVAPHTLLLNNYDVNQKILELEDTIINNESTITGISYNLTDDLTLIDNNVNITKILHVQGINILNELDNIENILTDISYSSNKTTILNDVDISGVLHVQNRNILNELDTLINNNNSLSGIFYDINTDTTIITNNVVMNNVISKSHTGYVDIFNNTYQNVNNYLYNKNFYHDHFQPNGSYNINLRDISNNVVLYTFNEIGFNAKNIITTGTHKLYDTTYTSYSCNLYTNNKTFYIDYKNMLFSSVIISVNNGSVKNYEFKDDNFNLNNNNISHINRLIFDDIFTPSNLMYIYGFNKKLILDTQNYINSSVQMIVTGNSIGDNKFYEFSKNGLDMNNAKLINTSGIEIYNTGSAKIDITNLSNSLYLDATYSNSTSIYLRVRDYASNVKQYRFHDGGLNMDYSDIYNVENLTCKYIYVNNITFSDGTDFNSGTLQSINLQLSNLNTTINNLINDSNNATGVLSITEDFINGLSNNQILWEKTGPGNISVLTEQKHPGIIRLSANSAYVALNSYLNPIGFSLIWNNVYSIEFIFRLHSSETTNQIINMGFTYALNSNTDSVIIQYDSSSSKYSAYINDTAYMNLNIIGSAPWSDIWLQSKIINTGTGATFYLKNLSNSSEASYTYTGSAISSTNLVFPFIKLTNSGASGKYIDVDFISIKYKSDRS